MKNVIVIFILSGILPASSLSAQNNGKVIDIDGNEYQTVIIGKQEWMAENLQTTRLNDGTRISLITDNLEWFTTTVPSYSWYDNNGTNYKNIYGALYNWHTIYTGKLCPVGWHVPSQEELLVLTNFLGGTVMPGGPILLQGELKSTRTTPDEHPRWNSPNKGATNSSGFTALPGGQRNLHGAYMDIGRYGFWWTSSAVNWPSEYAYYRGMRYDNSDVFQTSGHVGNGFSVRCLKN